MPISLDSAVPTKMIAMIGIIVSGIAVPTAARTLPTMPSPRPIFWPSHSMPFVNSSAPARMTMNETTRSARSRTRLTESCRHRRGRGPACEEPAEERQQDQDDREHQEQGGEGRL